MTSQPEVPGADAVMLLREEDTEDKLYSWSTHIRIKVLTEAGKKYAHVSLTQSRWLEDPGQWQHVHGSKVQDIDARTIHPDGKIIPFTGQTRVDQLQLAPGAHRDEISFDLPEVTVGSILEYSYRIVNSDNLLFAPFWNVQSELFTRKEHFLWRPIRRDSLSVVTHDKKGGQIALSLGWDPILPKNAVFTHDTLSGTGSTAGEYGQTVMELKVQDVPPVPHEPFMPPLANIRYRVQFYYVPVLTSEQFWKDEGKRWASSENDFIGPGPKVKAAVAKLVSATETDEQKLRKIYAATARVENITYTRGFLAGEDYAHNIPPLTSTDDIWDRQAAHSDQIAALFVALARAAGLEAYAMQVANRGGMLFDPGFLNFNQLGDTIAIVRVNGADQYFDPAVPGCPYGQLAWVHAASAGVRQARDGAMLAETPPQTYKDSRILRQADLTLDARGNATGTVKLTWIGTGAILLREYAVRNGNTGLNARLLEEAQRQLPTGTVVAIVGIANLDDPDKPLVVDYTARARYGTLQDGALTLPDSFFEAGTAPRFPAPARQTPVYFNHPYQIADAVRLVLPPGASAAASPRETKLAFRKSAVYSFSAESRPDSLVLRRDLVIGSGIYPVADYGELRSFFAELEAIDHKPFIVSVAAAGQAGE